MAQLSYAYALSQVELRPVGADPGSGTYVLCQVHLDRLKVPRGWQLLVRGDLGAQPVPDDVTAADGRSTAWADGPAGPGSWADRQQSTAPGFDPLDPALDPRARDLDALAQEIRRVGGLGSGPTDPAGTEHSLSRRANLVTLASRAHLKVVADAARYSASRPGKVG